MNEITRLESAGTEAYLEPVLEKPFKLTMCLTATCNMDCDLCYADCNRGHRPELTTDEWKTFIDHLVAEQFLHVFIEGGEPLCRDDFEEILAHIDRRLYISLRTHAHLIDAERARRLNDLGVGRVYVDLFAAIPEIQDELTGTPGCFDRVVDGIRHARAAGMRVTLLAILSRRNFDHLQRYVELAHSLGCDQLGILRLYPIGRAKRNWSKLSLTLDEIMGALNALVVPEGLHLMQSWHPRDGNCCWQNAAVSPYGQSIGCPYMREFVDYGDVRVIPFTETWNHPLYRQLRSGNVEAHCTECTTTQGTRGGCRSTAYAYHGRFTAPDPHCRHLNKTSDAKGVDLRDLPEWLLREIP